MSTNDEEIVRRWCREWPGLAPHAMLEFFTDDFVYRHVSIERPIVGARALAGMIEIFRARFELIETALGLIMQSGNAILCERVENFVLPGGRRVTLPSMASVVVRDGKIASWCDYFDLASLTSKVDVTEA